MVKIFKEENRMTVVFYDCTSETQDLITKMIKEANEEVPESTMVPELLPANTKAGAGVVITDLGEIKKRNYDETKKLPSHMPYAGMTAKQALKKDGVNALIKIYIYLKLLDEKKDQVLINTIQKEFKAFADSDYQKKIENIENIDIGTIQNYIVNIEPVLQETIDEILQKTTYQSVDSFVVSATKFELQSAYASLLKALKAKF